MAFMKRTHCGDKSYSSILFATDFARDGTHALAAINDFHG